ncbi:MAG TPA: transposase [Polyangiaceae bacterium]|nr:transposase [Polyangiaceae bacterium]
MRRRYTAEDKQRLLSEVRATGEGVAAVAKRLGVTPSSAYLWLKEAGVASGGPAPVFARVVKSTSSVAARSIVIEVGAAMVRVEPGFNVDLLRSVVAALGDPR